MQGKKVNVKRIEDKLNSIITKRASNGFPFFKIQLLPQITENQIVNCSIKADMYQTPIYYDTIVLPAKTKISKGYLINYLDINEGDLYNHTSLKLIGEKIDRLSFVTLKSPVQSRFSTQGAIIELPVEAKASGSFGGMVGFASNEKENKLQITGDISLKLQNAFKKGEGVNLVWRRTANQSQLLTLNAELPFLFRSHFGFYSDIDIQRIDTTLINTNNEFLGILHLSGLNQFRFGINHKTNSFLLSSDTTAFDTKTVLYNAVYIYNSVDNWFNPSNGFDFEVNFKTGNRLQKDSSMSKSAIHSFYLHCTKYWRLSWKNVLLTSIESGIIKYSNTLWSSELFRIGGGYSFRGFDEESIFASQYFFNTIEYRYRFERKSNVFAFFQAGGYRTASITNAMESYMYSSGIGAMMDTGVGVFTVMYAMGKSKEQDLKLRTAKIHFGYITRF